MNVDQDYIAAIRGNYDSAVAGRMVRGYQKSLKVQQEAALKERKEAERATRPTLAAVWPR